MDIIDSIVLREEIENILDTLTNEEKRIVLKYLVYGYSQQQISAMEGVSHQAISQKLGRMRRRLTSMRN